MDIKKWAKEVHTLAGEKGWHDKPRSFGEIRILIVSEATEALEEYRYGRMDIWSAGGDGTNFQSSGPPPFRPKPEGFPIELADMAIRCLDYLGFFEDWIPAHPQYETGEFAPTGMQSIPEELDMLVEDLYMVEGEVQCIDECLFGCLNRLRWLGYDAEKVVALKHEYNKTRPYRHGGKAA